MSCPWSESSYPHLGTPSTDSLSLVWTYRKGKLVNVPANLLVEGDVIVLGPGQECPAKVQQVCEAEVIPQSNYIQTPHFCEKTAR